MSARPILRAILALVFLPALAACTTDPQDRAQLAQLRMIGKARSPMPVPGFIAAQAANAPMRAAAVEKRPQSIAIFLRQSLSEPDGIGTWIGPDGAQLIFDHGLLVGTRGFGGDVLASQTAQSGALIRAMRAGYATRLMTLIDGDDRAVTEGFKCKVTRDRQETVIIGARPVMTQVMIEQCRGTDASFENYYWVTPGSGKVVQSSQWAGHFTGKISLRNAVRQ